MRRCDSLECECGLLDSLWNASAPPLTRPLSIVHVGALLFNALFITRRKAIVIKNKKWLAPPRPEAYPHTHSMPCFTPNQFEYKCLARQP